MRSRAVLRRDRCGPLEASPLRGRVICSCIDVSENEIRSKVAADGRTPPEARLASVQQALKCGTGCGSCLPEIRRLLQTIVERDFAGTG